MANRYFLDDFGRVVVTNSLVASRWKREGNMVDWIDARRARRVMVDAMYGDNFKDLFTGVGYDSKTFIMRYLPMNDVLVAYARFLSVSNCF